MMPSFLPWLYLNIWIYAVYSLPLLGRYRRVVRVGLRGGLLAPCTVILKGSLSVSHCGVIDVDYTEVK